MNEPLTARQRDVLEFLRDAAREGEAPGLDAICRGLGLRSRGSLHKHIQALVEAELVESPEGRHRGIRLTRAGLGDVEDPGLPLLGRIAAGRPIEAMENDRHIPVPPALRGAGPCYVLEVHGDSMRDEGILDGDWVVVEQRDQARNGELVVALVDGGEATLKRIEQRPGMVRLHAANPDYTAMEYAPDRVRIQGVVVGQMRRY